MTVTREDWNYHGDEKVWVGKFLNSQNSLHWHSACELIYVERGALDVACDGGTYSLGKGKGMFIPGEAVHRLQALTPETLLITVIFDSGIISDFASDIKLVSPIIENDHGIVRVYERLMESLKTRGKLYSYTTAAEVRMLMLDIFCGETTEPRRQKNKRDAKFKALFSQIQEHYETFTLEDAARFMGMNASYLSRFFAARTGMHLMRYVNGVRVEKAAELLRSEEYSVTEVATRCGFGTIRNFNRIFKLLTGYAPTAMPADYVYAITVPDPTAAGADPTLVGCELVESSDNDDEPARRTKLR